LTAPTIKVNVNKIIFFIIRDSVSYRVGIGTRGKRCTWWGR